jgi:hypothetical protein
MPEPTRAAIRKEADRVARAAQLRDKAAARTSPGANAQKSQNSQNTQDGQAVALNAGVKS